MKVALGIPSVESVPAEAFGHHLRLAGEIARQDDLVTITPSNVIPHDRARSLVVDCAKRMDCDLLFFVDDDTLVPKGAYQRLKEVMDDTQAQAVSGRYYRRGYPYTCVWSLEVQGKMTQVDARKGVHLIHTSGLGCALIDFRWICKHMEEPMFTMREGQKSREVTDDITFFDQMREKGGKLVGVADVSCVHVGQRVLIGDDNVDYLRKTELLEMQQ